jgi:hypothetical protein
MAKKKRLFRSHYFYDGSTLWRWRAGKMNVLTNYNNQFILSLCIPKDFFKHERITYKKAKELFPLAFKS